MAACIYHGRADVDWGLGHVGRIVVFAGNLFCPGWVHSDRECKGFAFWRWRVTHSNIPAFVSVCIICRREILGTLESPVEGLASFLVSFICSLVI